VPPQYSEPGHAQRVETLPRSRPRIRYSNGQVAKLAHCAVAELAVAIVAPAIGAVAGEPAGEVRPTRERAEHQPLRRPDGSKPHLRRAIPDFSTGIIAPAVRQAGCGEAAAVPVAPVHDQAEVRASRNGHQG